jgi:hypothetical protein
LAAMVLNVVLRLVPTRVKAAIAATAINAAINAYSTPNPGLVFDQIYKKSAQRNSPWFNNSNRAQAATRSLSNGKENKDFFPTRYNLGYHMISRRARSSP